MFGRLRGYPRSLCNAFAVGRQEYGPGWADRAPNLIEAIYKMLGIDYHKGYLGNIGRPVKLVHDGGTPWDFSDGVMSSAPISGRHRSGTRRSTPRQLHATIPPSFSQEYVSISEEFPAC